MKYRWFKRVSEEAAQAWEDECFAQGLDNVVVTGAPGGDQLLEAFFGDLESAERFRSIQSGAVEPLEEINWAALSCEGSTRKTIGVANRFLITLDAEPEFVSELRKESPDVDLLVFPPDMAFGTGDHETTAMCLELLCGVAPVLDWRLLDLGTGTGILAVAAAFLGASPIVATDFDPKAVEVAEASLARHELTGRIELREQDVLAWEPDEQFNIVVANLFSEVLIAAMPSIRASVLPDGNVILSGILRDQAFSVEQAAKDSGLDLVDRMERGKWVAMLLKPVA